MFFDMGCLRHKGSFFDFDSDHIEGVRMPILGDLVLPPRIKSFLFNLSVGLPKWLQLPTSLICSL